MINGVSSTSYSSYTSTSANATASKKFQEQLLARLDSDGDGTISATERNSALNASNSSQSTGNGNDATVQALSRMVATLTERYDTEDSKPVGKYLNTAA